MSDTQDIDQNGGAIKEPISSEETKVESLKAPTDQSIEEEITTKNTMDDTRNLSDTDISVNQKDSLQAESQSAPSNMNGNQEGKEKVNKSTNENEDSVVKIDQEETSSQSRELKLLLALSKEANLETNIPRTRKLLNLRKKARADSRSSLGKVPKIQYPVTAESELEMELHSAENSRTETPENDSPSIASTLKAMKRKKSIAADASGESVTDDTPKKSRKSFSIDVTIFKPNKDMFCWRCHKDGVNISCETCPRSYHQRCLKQTITDLDHWPCPECVSILKAESTQSRSPAMRGMTLENLCSLLKFAVNRMIQCQGSEPFIHAVNDKEFPEYKKYIIQPMDLTLLEKNIKENLYGSTQAFEADAKWILHNSIIFNSYQSKLTTVAKFIIKICKQEMSEIENCPSCYLNANTRKKTWFIEVCPKPHLLVWAKLRGFPFWPGKAMSCKDGMVDVRFFGAHDRAWVPEKECFLYSPKDPNLFRIKRSDIEQCVKELEVHVENLKKVYGEFHYPSFKTALDPDNEVRQLQIFLPRYKSYFNKHRIAQKRQSFEKEKTEVKEGRGSEGSKGGKPNETAKAKQRHSQESSSREQGKSEHLNMEDEFMEGYGTDDEAASEIDTELRKTLLRMPESGAENDDLEADEDDTQMPTNIEPDTSGVKEVVLTKSPVKRISGDKSPTKKSDSESSSKRSSFDDSLSHSVKTLRRNSETKTDSSRVSDRISRVDISEDMEITLGNDDKGTVSCVENVSSSNSESSSDFSVEIKKKPVQVDVDNVEYTISPASKLRIADKLIKRLSDGESEGSSSHANKVEQAKCNLSERDFVVEQPAQEKVLDSDPVSSTHDDIEGVVASKEDQVIKSNTSTAEQQMESFINENVESVHLEEAKETTEQIDDASTSFPDEIHEELHTADTKMEQEISDNDAERPQNVCDNTTNDNIKDGFKAYEEPLRDADKITQSVENATSLPKTVIKATTRAEEQLDQLMRKSMEEETTVSRRESVEARRSSATSSEMTLIDYLSTDGNAKTDGNENSPQRPSQPKKTLSPEKAVRRFTERLIEESEVSVSPEKQKLSVHDTDASKNVVKPATESRSSPMKAMSPQKDREPKDVESDEAVSSLDDVDLNIDKANIINIIHSSLNDISTSPTKPANSDENVSTGDSTPNSKPETRSSQKRKKSIDFDESALETQNKILKLVSIESIMNKANNNQDNENTSILKSSLQAKKITKPSSVQNSPNSSARSSIYEMSAEEIKSEPDSEAESGNVRNLEAKKKYLSALNILEKGEADAQKTKPHEIRTRSKTEEKRERFRVSNEPQVVDNMTKIIEDVAVNYSAEHESEALSASKRNIPVPSTEKPDGGEIFVKSFAKLVPDLPEGHRGIIPVPLTKQRARKSFPQPNYSKPTIVRQPIPFKDQSKVTTSTPVVLPAAEPVPRLTPRVPIASSSPISNVAPIVTPAHALKATVPPLQQLENMRPTNGYLILQPPQQEGVVFLPPNQTISYSTSMPSQVVSVTPCLVSAPTHTQAVRHVVSQPHIWQQTQNQSDRVSLNISESQNYIPQGECVANSSSSNTTVRTTAPSSNPKMVNGLPEPALVSSTEETPNSAANVTPASSNITDNSTENNSATIPESSVEPAVISETIDGDEFSVLNSLAPESVTRAVTEVIRRPPPRLKPRPPGALSQQFSEGTPSSAGPVSARINSISHRLGDYFRGMLIETLEDLGKTSSPEATIANLKLEIETLIHRHSIEISEIEKNMSTVLKDIQQSIIDDRERIIEETRTACEAETIKRVEEAKSKQWCASCSKEAQFYCCWNTSYCDYPCQQKHWPSHMTKCTQNVNQPAQITPSSTIRPGGQQLILRPANPPPKGGIGRVFTKPLQKVYMNRNVTAPKTMRVQTSTGSLLTMMETTPGNYQLVTSSMVRAGPSLTSIRPTGLISVPSPTNSASISTNPQQKSVLSKPSLRVLSHTIPVTTVLEEDSD